MGTIVSFLIMLVLLPYLFIPFLIRRNQLFSLKPNLRPLAEDFLPRPVLDYFYATTAELAALGFEPRIDVLSLDYGPQLKVFMRFFVATKTSVTAIATSLLHNGDKKPLQNFIEFNSRFIDGLEVSTHNSDLAAAPIESQQKHNYSLPFIDNITTLYSYHKHIIANDLFKNKPSFTIQPGTELNTLISNFTNELERQVALGCLVLDKKNQCFRPTWAGAILMGWYSMWPLSLFRRCLRTIKANLLHRSLNKQPR